MKSLLLFLVCVVSSSATARADQLGDWIHQQRAMTCFPWAFKGQNAPVRNYFPPGVSAWPIVSNDLERQMSGHLGSAPQTGTFAVYDPVHHIALASLGQFEDLSNDVLLTQVPPPPRTIAWRDLSHFNPDGHRVLGLTRANLELRFGRAKGVARCGMEAITFDYRGAGHGYISTFVLRNGRVIDYANASP